MYDGFTGLEAALILLAFIVVAAVFSFVVLGAGFFTIQKSQATIHSAVKATSSPLTIDNQIYGIENETSGKIGHLMFTVGNHYGSGDVVDLSGISVIWSTKDDLIQIPRSDPLYTKMPPPGTWGIVDKQGDAGSPASLETGEYATIIINMTPENELSERERFSFEMIHREGSISFEGSAPSSIGKVNSIYSD